MRDYEEIMNQILEFAKNDNRIRVVMINGSRVNSKAPVDIMQDYDVILIDCVRKLLSWYIGMQHEWNINVGKCGKWYKSLLEDDLFSRYVSLYSSVEYDDIWNKLFKTGEFIRNIGIELSTKLGYKYPMIDDMNVTEYITKIRYLPKDAKEI